MQSEINIRVANRAPNVYFEDVKKQCTAGKLKYGGINDLNGLEVNLKMNCIPEDIYSMDIYKYEEFLEKRRILMSRKIKDYYSSL